MEELSVRSLYCVSAVLCLCASACAESGTVAALTQDDLADPVRVAVWLKENSKLADRKQAQHFYSAGKAASAEGRLGIAVKAFSDSAILYPAPDTLAEYADALLREMGGLRARTGTMAKKELGDLTEAERVYRAALAADGELRVLGATAKQQLERDARCVADYLESKRPDLVCRPLGLYRQTK
jgi:hypothetical protein